MDKRDIRPNTRHIDDVLATIDRALTDYDDYVATVLHRIDNGRPAFTNVHAVA